MRVSLIQTRLHWENPPANCELLGEKIAPLQGRTDLIVLPEMFSTGFSMNPAVLAEPMDGPTVQWMRDMAQQTGAALTGSFICADGGKYYNRLVWMFPDGRFEIYDKRHLFTLAGERIYFAPGEHRLTVEWQGWRICPLVCYDLRFPVWSRNQAQNGAGEEPYDMLIFVANWPNRRAHHWKTLLAARAIENQCFTVGVNIFGTDGNGLEYSGDSGIVDFSGQEICRISDREDTVSAELSLEELRSYRNHLPFLADADAFKLV